MQHHTPLEKSHASHPYAASYPSIEVSHLLAHMQPHTSVVECHASQPHAASHPSREVSCLSPICSLTSQLRSVMPLPYMQPHTSVEKSHGSHLYAASYPSRGPCSWCIWQGVGGQTLSFEFCKIFINFLCCPS